MPSLTSLPLTARGPVSSLSRPILMGSFELCEKAAEATREKAKTKSPARLIHMCDLLRCRPGRGQHTRPAKAASTTPRPRPGSHHVAAHGVALAPFCRNAVTARIDEPSSRQSVGGKSLPIPMLGPERRSCRTSLRKRHRQHQDAARAAQHLHGDQTFSDDAEADIARSSLRPRGYSQLSTSIRLTETRLMPALSTAIHRLSPELFSTWLDGPAARL